MNNYFYDINDHLIKGRENEGNKIYRDATDWSLNNLNISLVWTTR